MISNSILYIYGSVVKQQRYRTDYAYSSKPQTFIVEFETQHITLSIDIIVYENAYVPTKAAGIRGDIYRVKNIWKQECQIL